MGRASRGLPLKFVHQSGLPDAGLASDEDDLPLSADRFPKLRSQLTQRPISSHNPGLRWDLRSGRFSQFRIANGRYELVPAPGQGLDISGILRIISQQVSDFKHVTLQNLGLYMSVGPHGIQEFVLRNQPAGAVHQISQNGERLRLQGKALVFAAVATPPKTLVDRVQPEWRELLHACV